VGSGYPSGAWNPGHGIWVGRKVIENAIVHRLRELNIVFDTESEAGLVGQMMRINEGAPTPEVAIDEEVDFEDEVKGLIGWAQGFLKRAPAETARRFFPPAQPRRLEPL
jgi:hypothetical protein